MGWLVRNGMGLDHGTRSRGPASERGPRSGLSNTGLRTGSAAPWPGVPKADHAITLAKEPYAEMEEAP